MCLKTKILTSPESLLKMYLKSDSNKAIEIVYKYYYANLFSVAYSFTKNREDTKDVLQDAILKIWKMSPNYDPKKSCVVHWMRIMVRSVSIDFLRRQKRMTYENQGLRLETHHHISHSPIQPDTIDLYNHINSLRLKYRCPLYLNYIEGYSHKDLSEKLNTPIGTIKNHISTAKKQLRLVFTNSLNTKRKLCY